MTDLNVSNAIEDYKTGIDMTDPSSNMQNNFRNVNDVAWPPQPWSNYRADSQPPAKNCSHASTLYPAYMIKNHKNLKQKYPHISHPTATEMMYSNITLILPFMYYYFIFPRKNYTYIKDNIQYVLSLHSFYIN